VRPPRLFLARRGVGRDLGVAGLSFYAHMRSGFNRRGSAAQRIKTIAFWAIYTYRNTYWRPHAQETHHHGVYEGLRTVIGRRRISRFLNDLARPHVVRQNLAAGYTAMAADEAREAEADAWSEGVLEDVADEPRRDR
jgi:hypothetical protein